MVFYLNFEQSAIIDFHSISLKGDKYPAISAHTTSNISFNYGIFTALNRGAL